MWTQRPASCIAPDHPHPSILRRAIAVSLLAAGAVLVAVADAAAVPVFQVQIFEDFNVSTVGGCVPTNSVNIVSAGPVQGRVVCGSSQGTESGIAGASFGHLGATATATSTSVSGFARMDAVAIFSDDAFIFTASNPGDFPGGLVPVSMNLALSGELNTTDRAGAIVTVRANINIADVGVFDRRENNGGLTSCSNTFASGGGCDSVAVGGGIGLVTQSTLVPLDTPVLVQLRLDVSVGAAGDAGITPSATASFGNSFDFPIGADLFNLPDGVTVNAPELFIVDNRFLPPGAATVPEPGALFVLAFGLAGWFAARRAPG